MVQRMLKMAELRDPKETYPHVMRVAENSLEIYDRWAFDHNIPEHEKHCFRDCLKIAAKFHDIGKVGIPDAVLHSPKRYDPNDKNRAVLKPEGLLTRDPRMVERKKFGQKKARKRFQFSKR